MIFFEHSYYFQILGYSNAVFAIFGITQNYKIDGSEKANAVHPLDESRPGTFTQNTELGKSAVKFFNFSPEIQYIS